MTVQNDFNALINAIIDNLEEMGVTNVSFESETGIMGLIDRILEIKTEFNVEIPTTIECSFPNHSTGESITVGDLYTCSGTLSGSYNDFSFKIGGATIYAYNHDDLLGQAVTNSDGKFTINGMYHKATSSVSYSLRFLATDIFLSSALTESATKPVNKKSITLPQSINDTWTLIPDEYSINIGSQYQGAPITLMIDSQKYDMEYVDENGIVTFDISSLTGVNKCQLIVETNDVFSNAQSNTFNILIGVNIYINPELQVTSDKDILSYADNESATITAQLIGGAPPQNLEIPNYDIIFSIPTNYTDISNIPTQYGSFAISFKATQGTFNVVGDATNYDKVTVTIPSNNASQFKLVWNNGAMRLYKDGQYLRNNVIDMMRVDTDTYEGGYANFENNNGITFSDICMEYYEATDNTGKAALTYNSRGVGDVTIIANIEGSLVSKTYEVQDCWGYDVPSSDKSSRYSSTMFIRESANGQSVSYNSNGYYTHSISVNGHKGVFLPFIEDATDDFCIECDVKKTSGVCGLGVYYDSNNTYQLETNSNVLRVGKNVSGTFSETTSTSSVIKNNEWQHYKFEVIGNNIKLTVTDENSDTVSVNQDIPTRNSNVKCFLSIAYVQPQQNLFKNLKIKPL